MTVEEIVTQKQSNAKRSQKTDFEKNAAKLRSKKLDLRPQSPVPPVKHRP
ncbi:MAG: hypothetical protein ACXIU7_10680 [Roseinatronobacter sp.]